MRLGDMEGIEMLETSRSKSFVLDASVGLSGTGFKALCGQDGVRYVPVVRSRLNGKQKLTYLTGGYVPLDSFLSASDPTACQRVLRALVASVRASEGNGFLPLQGIVVEQSFIFVDAATSSVLLVYLPLARNTSAGDRETCRLIYDLCFTVYEALLGRSAAIQDLKDSPVYHAGNLQALFECLSQGLGDISGAFGDDASHRNTGTSHTVREVRPPVRTVPAAHPLFRFEPIRGTSVPFTVSEGASIIGKHPSRADVVIVGNPAVSRLHCRCNVSIDGDLTICDLGSVNGTFVNRMRLAANEAVRLSVGDQVRIANIEFVVQRGV